MGRPCVCCRKPAGGCDPDSGKDDICWLDDDRWARSGRGTMFPRAPDDIVISQYSDLTNCGCVVMDYYHNGSRHRGGVQYIDPTYVKRFLESGGFYITNCEYIEPSQPPFNEQMAAIGSSLRGNGYIEPGGRYVDMVTLPSRVFQGCVANGAASAEISGGTPLLDARRDLGRFPGGIVCAGEKVRNGYVIAFGDSNVTMRGPFRDNMFNILRKRLNPFSSSSQPLP